LATFTLFDEFINNLLNGNIDLDSDTFKAVLTNSAPTADTHDELADITQIANGDGYTTGGVTLTGVALAETGAGTGVWRWTADDFSWTASGAGFGPFRYVVIYSDTSTGDKLVGLLDYGSSISITASNSFTVDVGSNGILQASEA
jgi:hypothetical protein